MKKSLSIIAVVFLAVTIRAEGALAPKARSENRTANKTNTPVTSQRQSAQRKAPAMSDQQKVNIDRLVNDLRYIKAGSQITQTQKDKLVNDLKILAQGTTKPSSESVDKLSTDLSAALADGQLSKNEQVQLINDVEKVLNSANIPMSEIDAVIKGAQEIMTASGITKEGIQIIVSDLKAIAEELKKNLQTIADYKK